MQSATAVRTKKLSGVLVRLVRLEPASSNILFCRLLDLSDSSPGLFPFLFFVLWRLFFGFEGHCDFWHNFFLLQNLAIGFCYRMKPGRAIKVFTPVIVSFVLILVLILVAVILVVVVPDLFV